MTDMEMKDMNLEELEEVSGGWSRGQLTPEERKRLEELEWNYALVYRSMEDGCDSRRLSNAYAELKQFKSEMQAKYGA